MNDAVCVAKEKSLIVKDEVEVKVSLVEHEKSASVDVEGVKSKVESKKYEDT